MRATRSAVYRIKGVDGIESTMKIMAEVDDGYEILLTSKSEGRSRTSREFMPLDLFESCVRTGYLMPLDLPMEAAATA